MCALLLTNALYAAFCDGPVDHGRTELHRRSGLAGPRIQRKLLHSAPIRLRELREALSLSVIRERKSLARRYWCRAERRGESGGRLSREVAEGQGSSFDIFNRYAFTFARGPRGGRRR